ncbi:hypothetical protein CONCODRAFT_70789 [Conidiobolus coronatus NRRL 28638]|uniref:RRM domain-containing protein n=1 Tax=Conidiobolus coronatus (strain ATCC 28846 / CBS 209.66 / NRRL 28638) TaxID=796925 RepID=A0A137P5P2_CONC2|nr:hypothetical protein CONCODRAFT_70789 [Conidiobolus coronatus NRRL 28638]|eukprot:KXN70326.1 hypothetical protein CONCODRAFT_70789 [Conidiobolus coronatus NRRL 28638]
MSDKENSPKINKPTAPNNQVVQFDDEYEFWFYIDKSDKLVYRYDDKLKAWFPQLDNKLETTQQSIYGGDNDDNDQVLSVKEKRAQFKAKQKEKQEQEKLDLQQKQNTSIYVTGLPKDVEEIELKETFEKYGLIMEDLITEKPRIKIYKNEAGECKGDALITYFKHESVPLAITLLDESPLRPGDSLLMRITQAEFSKKSSRENDEEGNNDSSKRPKLDQKVIKKKLHNMEKKLGWHEAELSSKLERFEKIVCLRNMFRPSDIDKDPTLLIDLKEDIRSECEKLGEVTNVVLYDKSEEGAVTIRYKDNISAQACIKLMNGRNFDGRRVVAELYDGTKYDRSGKHGANSDDEEERLKQYEHWLENDNE